MQREGLEEDDWYLPDVSRSKSCDLLQDKNDGCFLIRKRQQRADEATHALSVVARGKIYHALIYQVNNKFGFRPNDCPFPTLDSLVLFYSHFSLEKHNTQLAVCLTKSVLSS